MINLVLKLSTFLTALATSAVEVRQTSDATDAVVLDSDDEDRREVERLRAEGGDAWLALLNEKV